MAINGYPFYAPLAQELSDVGAILPGAKLYVYAAGTLNPVDTYTDAELTTPHANPVIAGANGRFPAIYLDPAVAYKFDCTDSSDVSVPGYPVDDYQVNTDLTQAAIGAALYPIIQAELDAGLSAADINIWEPYHHFARYKVVNDGSQNSGAWTGTDNTTPFNNAAKVARILTGGEFDSSQKEATTRLYIGGAYKMWAPGGNYYAPGQIDFRDVQVDIDGIIRTGTAAAAASVILGNDGARPGAPQRIFGVLSDDGYGTVNDRANVDVQINGCNGQTITIEGAAHVRLYTAGGYDADEPNPGDNGYGTTNDANLNQFANDYHLGRITNVTVDCDEPPTDQRDPANSIQPRLGGWVNTNDFYLKNVKSFMVNGSNRYFPNHNMVHGGLADDAYIYLNRAISWHFRDMRLEGLELVSFGDFCADCFVEGSYRNNLDDWPGANYDVTTITADTAINCHVLRREIFGYQHLVAYHIDAETLQMDDDSNPKVYNIKGVGGQLASDNMVAPGDEERGTITRANGRLVGNQNDCILFTDYIPVSAHATSSIRVAMRGAADADAGLRCTVMAFDRDKNPFRIPGGEQKEISDTNVFQWTNSTTTPGEYYLEKVGGGDPKIAVNPNGIQHVYMDDGTVDSYIDEGTLGSLNDHEWAWGDQDTLMFDTIYIADASGPPDSSASRKFYADRAATNIDSMTQAYSPVITTTIKHGLSNGDIVILEDLEPSGTGDPGDGNNMESRRLEVSDVTDYTFSVNRDNRNFTALTGGRVKVPEMIMRPGNYETFGRESVSGDDMDFVFQIVAPDVYYVRVRVQAGDAPAMEFDSLAVSVLHPKSNFHRFDKNQSPPNDGSNVANLMPMFNPPTLGAPLSGDDTPTLATGGPILPRYFGDTYIDTTNNKVYVATALSSPVVVGDWTILN